MSVLKFTQEKISLFYHQLKRMIFLTVRIGCFIENASWNTFFILLSMYIYIKYNERKNILKNRINNKKSSLMCSEE